MSEATASSSLADELHELAAPLYERLRKLEARLEELDAESQAVRADRNQVRSVLRVVDPTFKEPTRPRAKEARVSDEAIQRATEFLEAHRAELNGNTFTATDLTRRDDWKVSNSYSAKTLRVLHERGVIRLDHTGRGGSRHYAVV